MNKIAAHLVHPVHFLYHTHAQLILKTTASNQAWVKHSQIVLLSKHKYL